MSDTKFTPGPWSFVPSIPEEGVECFWIENGVQQITSINGPQNDGQEANARLIAAAPDLFEALRMIAARDAHRGTVLLDVEEMDVVRAAIAKATGEQA